MIEKFIQNEMEYFQPMLERQKVATVEASQAWRCETVAQRLERISLETYDLCEGIVIQGPFQGLKLNKETWWGKSDLGSQCLGLYEKEILNFISERGPIDVFLDIGAADGYYSVGMLHSQMTRKSICFELSEEGQRAIRENWFLNDNPGSLDVYGEANHESIEKIAATLPPKSLILIDIEGFEFTLLNPRIISLFKNCTIVVEIHNWVCDFSSKYENLLRNLSQHFEIHTINPASRNSQDIPLLRSYTDDNRLLVTSERRPCLMRFLHLEPKKCFFDII